MRRLKIDPWMVVSLVLAVMLVGSLVASTRGVNLSRYRIGGNSPVKGLTAKLVSAEEIYPLFFCPCCGQPLDKNKICCGAAKERIDYIDSLVTAGKSEEEIILDFVKKYGSNSFVEENKRKEFREKLIASAPTDRPQIMITPETYDFGDVSQKAGKIYTYFDLKNEGKKDLVINRLETSCGCTFAAVVFKDKESPYFAMPGHGYENPEWEGITIPPGETAQLKIMYDPDIHKDFRGPATREVYVFSNDPIDFEKKAMIELNQVD